MSSVIVDTGFFSPSDAINFDEVVLGSDEVWMLEFYSDMCGSCKQFTPKYVQLAQNHPTIRSGNVNIDKADGMRLATKLSAFFSR